MFFKVPPEAHKPKPSEAEPARLVPTEPEKVIVAPKEITPPEGISSWVVCVCVWECLAHVRANRGVVILLSLSCVSCFLYFWDLYERNYMNKSIYLLIPDHLRHINIKHITYVQRNRIHSVVRNLTIIESDIFKCESFTFCTYITILPLNSMGVLKCKYLFKV